MFGPNPQGLPGVYGPYVSQPRTIWLGNGQFEQDMAVAAVIDGSLSSNSDNVGTPGGTGDYRWLLFAGTLMGKITATGKYRPSVIGLTAGLNSNSTSLVVSAAVASEVNRLIGVTGGNVNLTLVGPPTAGGTVASANVAASAASGTTVTLTAGPGANYIAGSLIMPRDGSQAPRGILADQHGVAVVDQMQNRIDAAPAKLATMGGTVNVGYIVDYPADASAQAWLKAQIKVYCPGLTFSDDQLS